ncbi:MAG: fibronectin type III domain-containing protein [Actinomycetota bacterium]
MKRRLSSGLLVGLVSLTGIIAADSSPRAVRAASRSIRLDDATMIVEVNATDRDAGLQLFLDGEAWSSMTVSAPGGQSIVAINTKGDLKGHGLTELFSESSEPSFKEFPLGKFKKLFPEGRYTFKGTTIEGRSLVGSARLSHDFPDGPQITSPAEGSTVGPGNLVASWNPVPEPAGISVVGYRAIVEREGPLRVFSVDLPASVTSVTVPKEFMEPGTKYKLEVQAIEAGGNQTITEIEFSTS